jgi:2-dehydropantoate 2-reductase
VSAACAAAFDASTFSSRDVPDVMRLKWRKLIVNLTNSVEALFGPQARDGEFAQRASAEGEACLRAAGIDAASAEDDRARRAGVLRSAPVGGQARLGGSTWQSLQRGTGDVETDYLNGEVVLLGRLHGVPTPVNQLLQTLSHRVVAEGMEPGSFDPAEFTALLAAAENDHS